MYRLANSEDKDRIKIASLAGKGRLGDRVESVMAE
jgi:hypothetical protein